MRSKANLLGFYGPQGDPIEGVHAGISNWRCFRIFGLVPKVTFVRRIWILRGVSELSAVVMVSGDFKAVG